MPTHLVRRLAPISFANLVALVLGSTSAIFVVLIFGAMILSRDSSSLMAEGLLVVALMPLMYALMGWTMGAVGALAYNATIDLTGGINIELEAVEPKSGDTVIPSPGASGTSNE